MAKFIKGSESSIAPFELFRKVVEGEAIPLDELGKPVKFPLEMWAVKQIFHDRPQQELTDKFIDLYPWERPDLGWGFLKHGWLDREDEKRLIHFLMGCYYAEADIREPATVKLSQGKESRLTDTEKAVRIISSKWSYERRAFITFAKRYIRDKNPRPSQAETIRAGDEKNPDLKNVPYKTKRNWVSEVYENA